MLKKNSNYKELYLYQWIKEDLQRFLDEHPTEAPI